MIRRHPIHYIIESPKGRSKLILFRDGVLTLTFPKREESKPKQLKINVS